MGSMSPYKKETRPKHYEDGSLSPATLSPERGKLIISMEVSSYPGALRTVEHAIAFAQIKTKVLKLSVPTTVSLDT